MELKTKYQYTYFIYPYLIEEKNYQKYLYKLLKNEQCRLKLFDNKKDIQMTIWSKNPVLDMYPREIKTHVHKKACAWMFIAALFGIAPN